MILLSESQHFPPVILIKAAIDCTHIKFDLYDDYRKMSFRNRCVLSGGNGTVDLSIPLVDGRNQRRPMHAVQIDHRTGWQAQHWKTITSCYNRSPWFEFYKYELEHLYKQKVGQLASWNRLCWDWLVQQLDAGIETGYMDKGPFEPGPGYLDWRNKLMPRSIAGSFPEPVRYRQVFEDRTGFIPHLSILDLLFCVGPKSAELLKATKIPT